MNNNYYAARNSLKINITLVALHAKTGHNGKSPTAFVFFKAIVIWPVWKDILGNSQIQGRSLFWAEDAFNSNNRELPEKSPSEKRKR